MLNRSRSPALPTFQRLQASMREFDQNPMAAVGATPRQLATVGSSSPSPAAAVSPCSQNHHSGGRVDANWREAGEELRRIRSRVVVLIERMLRSHQPHDVLTQVPENNDWRSKTFVLALKIERLMFLAAPSRENYLNEHTLRSRVQLLSRHLVRIRKRKNAIANLLSPAV